VISGPNGTTQRAIDVTRAGNDSLVDVKVPLEGFASGRYHVAITAALPGGKPVSRDVLFEIK
jgi:hypothetical protein